jgi:RNA polymerase sigma-70 factor, ECF subfamily
MATNKKREQFLLFRIRVFKDESAFASLLESHGPTLQRFLYFKLPTQSEVEDAYSTVSLRLWEYITRTSVEHFSALMHTVARSVVADYYRQTGRTSSVPIETEETGPLPIEAKESHESIIDRVDVSLVKEALRLIEDEDREVITMRFFEGFRVKDIAQHIGKSENATSVMLHRALKKLRSLIEKY